MSEINTSNDWSGNAKASFVTNGDSNHSERERGIYDYYATDPRAVEALLKRETFNKNVLEPACGGGHISSVLETNGYSVESVDIVNRGQVHITLCRILSALTDLFFQVVQICSLLWILLKVFTRKS